MSRAYPLVNECERAFEEVAAFEGWATTKRGWPDFLCTNEKTGERIAVEVKPRTKNGRLVYLKRDQADCMDFLSSLGVRCFVSDGETLEPYSRERHRPG